MEPVFSLVNSKMFFVNRRSCSAAASRNPQTEVQQSKYTFSGLSIHLLRPEAIKTIMKKTFANNENMTIKEACGLNDTQLDEVAQHLFHQTCGHPRSLIDVFTSCRSFSQLMNYDKPLDIENWTLFYGALRKYKKHVSNLLDEMSIDGMVDLTGQIEDAGKRRISLDIIANNCCIAWEGTVDKAKLYYAPPFVLQLI